MLGRSIVKLSGFHDSIRTGNSYEGAVYALDEAGELWSWGSARLGLLGIGSENVYGKVDRYRLLECLRRRSISDKNI